MSIKRHRSITIVGVLYSNITRHVSPYMQANGFLRDKNTPLKAGLLLSKHERKRRKKFLASYSHLPSPLGTKPTIVTLTREAYS